MRSYLSNDVVNDDVFDWVIMSDYVAIQTQDHHR